MDELVPISEINTRFTRGWIVQLCQEARVRAEKRSVGGVEFWFVSQADVTEYEAEMEAAGTSKHAWRRPEPETVG